MDDRPDVEVTQNVDDHHTGHDDRDRKLIVLAIVAVVAMLIAGLMIGYQLTHNEQAASANQKANAAQNDALVAVCSSLTTVRFVFEQLAILDHQVATNPATPPTLKPAIRARATLYQTAVLALSDIRECRKIE